MKTTALLFLFIFVSFLMTPTLVCILKHNADISFVFNLAEEENKSGTKTAKEVELNTENKNDLLLALQLFKTTFFDCYSMSTEQVYLTLVSPPPEL